MSPFTPFLFFLIPLLPFTMIFQETISTFLLKELFHPSLCPPKAPNFLCLFFPRVSTLFFPTDFHPFSLLSLLIFQDDLFEWIFQLFDLPSIQFDLLPKKAIPVDVAFSLTFIQFFLQLLIYVYLFCSLA